MGAMAPQITRVSIVCWTVCSGEDERKRQSVTSLCEGNSPVTGEFPAQRTSNAASVSMWWRHHGITTIWILTISVSATPPMIAFGLYFDIWYTNSDRGFIGQRIIMSTTGTTIPHRFVQVNDTHSKILRRYQGSFWVGAQTKGDNVTL